MGHGRVGEAEKGRRGEAAHEKAGDASGAARGEESERSSSIQVLCFCWAACWLSWAVGADISPGVRMG